jgi:hypothetical protein
MSLLKRMPWSSPLGCDFLALSLLVLSVLTVVATGDGAPIQEASSYRSDVVKVVGL